MGKFNRGNAKIIVISLAAILLMGSFIYWQAQDGESYPTLSTKGGEADQITGEIKNNKTTASKVLATKNSTYSEFDQKDYEKALSDGKIVYLEFYANWCPICRVQEPELIEGFNKLSRADIAGFRVNYKDDQTDAAEKALAAKYKIPYQHHKIVLKKGNVVIDSPVSWDAQTLISEFSKL